MTRAGRWLWAAAAVCAAAALLVDPRRFVEQLRDAHGQER